MATTTRAALIATPFVLLAIGLIVASIIRGHPIDKRDLADLYGCYTIENQQLFRLTPDALVTPLEAVTFTARQGKYHAYLDLARPMRLVRRGAMLSFDPSPEPTGPTEVCQSTPRALLLPSASGPPILALRSECRP